MSTKLELKVLNEYQADRIRAILRTYYRVAFFGDTLAARADIKAVILDHDAQYGESAELIELAGDHQTRLDHFNSKCRQSKASTFSESATGPAYVRMILSLGVNSGYRIDNSCRNLVAVHDWRTYGDKVRAKIAQAFGRVHVHPNDPNYLVTGEITYDTGKEDEDA